MPRSGPPLSTAMLDAAVDLIGETGHLGSVEVAGNSMHPTFSGVERLAVQFGPVQPSFGDVLVFHQRERLVVHRLVHKSYRTEGLRLRTRGDGSVSFDPWLEPQAVIGRVVAVGYPDGTWRNLRNLRARFYGAAVSAHNFCWGGLGAFFLKYMGGAGADWQWRVGRLDAFKLGVVHAVLFRILHPVVPTPSFDGSGPAVESATVEARCYTPEPLRSIKKQKKK